MADIFLSYKREDRDRAAAIVAALRAAGRSVWLDEGITPRQAWDATIEQEIAAAASVVVLWSPRSVASDWVRSEAHYAQNHAKLVPVLIEACTIPLAFMLRQAVDLTSWRESRDDPEWRKLLEWLDTGGQMTGIPPSPGGRHAHQRWKRKWTVVAVAAIVVAALLVAFVVYRTGNDQSTEPSISVAPFKTPPDDQVAASFSQGFAADLAQIVVSGGSKLKVLDATDPAAGHAYPADFILNGSVRSVAGMLRATITLNSTVDGAIIWSTSLARPVADVDAMHHEAEVRMGAVFVCALGKEALNRSIVSLDALKVYLQACEAFPLGDNLHTRKLLRDVTALAPDFAQGWATLAQMNAFMSQSGDADADASRKEALDAAARALAIAPRNSAAWVARAMAKTKISEWPDAQADLAKALALDPDEPMGNVVYASNLLNMGRISEALEYAMRAANSGPPFEEKTVQVVETLADLGRLDEAKSMLQTALQTWRDKAYAGDLEYASAEIAARYDDPAQAAKILDEPAVKAALSPEQLQLLRLEAAARADPSPANLTAAAQSIKSNFVGPDNAYDAAINYTVIGRTDDAFAAMAKMSASLRNTGYVDNPAWLFKPFAAKFRADPRFMPLAVKLGLVAIWKATKWPDFCTASDAPYDCRAVAAKLTR